MILLKFSLVLFMWLEVSLGDPLPRTCEPITVDMCRNIGYNMTGMPNLARHTTQADADVTMQTFSPLLQYGCSSQLHLFLCSVYFPMCTDKVALPIGPCQGLCEGVYSRCYPVLKEFGFPWPAEFNCSRFPVRNNHEHMCMEGPGESASSPNNVLPSNAIAVTLNPAYANQNNFACQKYSKSTSYVFLSRSGRCAQFCDADVLYDSADKSLAEVWLSIWAALCFLCTVLGVATWLAGGGGGSAGERPLVLMALCHGLAAVGWGVRAAGGHAAVACTRDAASPRPILSQDGLANPNCAVVFLLLYYFGMAASVWWVVLAGSWRSHVSRRARGVLAGSAASSGGPPLHLAAWGLPAIQTVAVLVVRDVDADELTGICFVGNQSTRTLMALVIIPQLAYLVVGCSLLLLGFRTLLCSRNQPPIPAVHTHNPTLRKDPADNVSLLRLGIFAVIYIVPTSFIIASWLYEYFSRDEWVAAVKPSPVPSVAPKPAMWIFLVRILMQQILGVMTSVWVMSPRALQAWKRLFQRMGQPVYKPAPVKIVPQPIPIHYYAPQMHSLPKRSHSHTKYPSYGHSSSHRNIRPHHAYPLPLPMSGGETIL